jgi:hypothetical protein
VGYLQQDERNRLTYALNDLVQAPIHIDDTAGANLMEMHAKPIHLPTARGLRSAIKSPETLATTHFRCLCAFAQRRRSESLKPNKTGVSYRFSLRAAFWSAMGGTGVALAIAGFWFNNYFGKYLSKKAENLATHEDIQKLVDQVRETEKVKAEVADRMWDRQRRWDVKKDLYVDAYASLRKVYEHLIYLAVAREHIEGNVADNAQFSARMRQMQSDMAPLDHAAFVAPLFLSDSATLILAAITRDVKGCVQSLTGDNSLTDVDCNRFQHSLNDEIVNFAAEARRDLGYPKTGN